MMTQSQKSKKYQKMNEGWICGKQFLKVVLGNVQWNFTICQDFNNVSLPYFDKKKYKFIPKWTSLLDYRTEINPGHCVINETKTLIVNAKHSCGKRIEYTKCVFGDIQLVAQSFMTQT